MYRHQRAKKSSRLFLTLFGQLEPTTRCNLSPLSGELEPSYKNVRPERSLYCESAQPGNITTGDPGARYCPTKIAGVQVD